MSVEQNHPSQFEPGDFVDYLAFRWKVAGVIEDEGLQFLRLIMDGAEVPRVDAREVLKVNPRTGRQFKRTGNLQLVVDKDS